MAYTRETVPSIIQIDTRTVRAGRGLAELLARPSVNIPARFGLVRRARGGAGASAVASTSASKLDGGDVEMDGQAEERPLSDYLVGAALDEALAKQAGRGAGADEETVDVFWPWEAEVEEGELASVKRKAARIDWQGREAILNYVFTVGFGISPATNITTLLLIPPPTPAYLPPDDRAAYCRIAFERLNTPAFAILDAPAAAIYGVNATGCTGLVVHLGKRRTEVSVVVDSLVRYELASHADVGEEDCVRHLAELLLADTSVPGVLPTGEAATVGQQRKKATQQTISSRQWIEETAREMFGEDEAAKMTVALEVARAIFTADGNIKVPAMGGGHVQAPEQAEGDGEEDGVLDVAKILTKDDAAQTLAQLKESNKTKKTAKELAAAATAAAQKAAEDAAALAERQATEALDLYTCAIPAFGGKSIAVGQIRHRACEPLVLGRADGGRTVQEALFTAAQAVEPIVRQAVCDGLVFVGEMAEIQSLPLAIVSYLTPYLLADAESESDVQPTRVRMLRVPDYFANFKGYPTSLAPFLGACLAAKLIFADNAAMSFVNKLHYNQHGPAAINLAEILE